MPSKKYIYRKYLNKDLDRNELKKGGFWNFLEDSGKLLLNTLAAPTEAITGNNYVDFNYNGKAFQEINNVSEGILGGATHVVGNMFVPGYAQMQGMVEGVAGDPSSYDQDSKTVRIGQGINSAIKGLAPLAGGMGGGAGAAGAGATNAATSATGAAATGASTGMLTATSGSGMAGVSGFNLDLGTDPGVFNKWLVDNGYLAYGGKKCPPKRFAAGATPRKMAKGGPVKKKYKPQNTYIREKDLEFMRKYYPTEKGQFPNPNLLRDYGVPSARDVYFYPHLFPQWREHYDELKRKMNPNKMHIFFDMRDKKQNGGYIPPPVSEEREKELLHKYIGNFVPYDKNPETGQKTISSEEMGPDHWLYDVSPTEGLDKRQAFYIMKRFANPLTRRPAPMQGPIAEEYINPEGEDRSEWLQKSTDSPLRRYDLDENLKPQNPRRYEISNTYEMAYGGPKKNFHNWYKRYSSATGNNPDPYAKEHYYDYESFFNDNIDNPSALFPVDTKNWHLPSKYKKKGHPRMFKYRDGSYGSKYKKGAQDTRKMEEGGPKKPPKNKEDFEAAFNDFISNVNTAGGPKDPPKVNFAQAVKNLAEQGIEGTYIPPSVNRANPVDNTGVVIRGMVSPEKLAQDRAGSAATEKAKKDFYDKQWEKYEKASVPERVLDRTKAFMVDPIGMTARFLAGKEAYFPGMAEGLLNTDDPEYLDYLEAVGYTPGKFEASDVQNMINPMYWGASIGNSINKKNYADAYIEAGLTALPFMPKTIGKSLSKGARKLVKNPPELTNKLMSASVDSDAVIGELLGELKQGKLNRESIEKGNKWLKDWIEHPATQKKISDDAFASRQIMRKHIQDPDALEAKLSEIYLLEDQAKNFIPNSKEYTLMKQLKENIDQYKSILRNEPLGESNIHRGNYGVSYMHGASPFKRELIESKPELMSDRYGSWISRDPRISQKKRESTTIHEGTHDWASDHALNIGGRNSMRRVAIENMDPDIRGDFFEWEHLRSQGKDPAKIMGKEKAHQAYLANPTEMHARIMEIRRFANLKPDKPIDITEANNLISRIEEMPKKHRPIDINMFKVLGKDRKTQAKGLKELMNRLWAAPAAVGGAGAAIQAQGNTVQEMSEGGPKDPPGKKKLKGKEEFESSFNDFISSVKGVNPAKEDLNIEETSSNIIEPVEPVDLSDVRPISAPTMARDNLDNRYNYPIREVDELLLNGVEEPSTYTVGPEVSYMDKMLTSIKDSPSQLRYKMEKEGWIDPLEGVEEPENLDQTKQAEAVLKKQKDLLKKEKDFIKASHIDATEYERYNDSDYQRKDNKFWGFVYQNANDKGMTYIPGARKEIAPEYYEGVQGVAHFLINSDLTDGEMHDDTRSAINSQKRKGNYVPYYKKSEDGTVNVRYAKGKKEYEKMKSEGYEEFANLRQIPLSEIDWDSSARPYHSPQDGDKDNWTRRGIEGKMFGKSISNILTKDGKDTWMIYKEMHGQDGKLGRFNGNSLVFITETPKGRLLTDFAGPVAKIKNKAEELKKTYKVKDSDITLGFYDAGSYSAKPVADENGRVYRNQWSSFNKFDEKSGASLMIPR